MDEIEKNDFKLNISHYVSTAKPEEQIDLQKTNNELVGLEKSIVKFTKSHNEFLKEPGLVVLPEKP